MDAPGATHVSALREYLEQLSASRFWGSLTLKFEAGQVVHARREENIKPSELSGTPRTHANSTNR
jgi:hypothetical protein